MRSWRGWSWDDGNFGGSGLEPLTGAARKRFRPNAPLNFCNASRPANKRQSWPVNLASAAKRCTSTCAKLELNVLNFPFSETTPNRPTVTLGGRSLTLGGQSTPAHCRHLRGKRQFSAWTGLAKCLQALAAVKLCTGTVHKPVEKPDFYRHLRGATLDTWGAASLTLGGPATDI